VGLLLASEFGWRLSLASWGLISLLAIAPYVVLLPLALTRTAAEKEASLAFPTTTQANVGRSATARAIMLAFAVSGFTAYTVFGVLPKILIDYVGVTAELAAIALTVFSIMGMPMSLIIPNLAVRTGWSGRLIGFAAVSGATGFLGIAFLPGVWTIVWTVLIALNTLTFSMSLALIGARTATHHMATELSGYVNTVGYLIAAAGPIVVGAVHELTDSWFIPLLVLALFATVLLPAGAVLARESTIEAELEAIER
jgi:CP family cyanate transporter-like MFS transporter